eukprot:jgi/Orpsp1_1/1183171/evm.model.c7180000084177.2
MWTKNIRNILVYHQLVNYIDTDIMNNNPTAEDNRNDALVMNIITNSVAPNIYPDIEDCASAFSMMDQLKTLHEGDPARQLEKFINQLNKLRPRNYEEILKAFTGMNTIFRKMTALGYQLSEKEKVQYMFSALPEDLRIAFIPNTDATAEEYFNLIKSKNIFIKSLKSKTLPKPQPQKEDFMDLDYVYKPFKDRESNKKRRNNKRRVRKYCHICKTNTHNTDECFFNAKTNKDISVPLRNKGGFKNFSKQRSHFNNIENFQNHIDFDDEVSFENLRPMLEKSIDSIESINNVDENIDINNNNINNSMWTYDSGAIAHITNNKNLLSNYINKKFILKCANNTPIEFEGYGDYHGEINNHSFTLKRVLYSKNANKNLISDIKLVFTDIKALSFRSGNNACLILYDNNNNIINKYTSENGNLTNYNISDKYYNFENNKCLCYIDEELWHKRLAHFYHKNLSKYLKSHNVDTTKCKDCQIAKLKRKPHNKFTPKAHDILDVIHSPTQGPITESINKKTFIITFVDEYTRKGWVFTLKNKSEAVNTIINFLKHINNLIKDKSIKYFKTDQGKEYYNKKVLNFCNKNGIKKIFSPPYNPENNI